jgi:hypothetical protein
MTRDQPERILWGTADHARKFREVFTPKELLCKRFGIGLARQRSPSSC